jgi:hypothetical protein
VDSSVNMPATIWRSAQNSNLYGAYGIMSSYRTRRIIWWNFAGTIGVDMAGMALVSAGLLSPTFAAFIHVTSELAFLLNSARLLPRRKQSAPVQKCMSHRKINH